MSRLLLCLPLCLLLASDRGETLSGLPGASMRKIRDDGLVLPNADQMEQLARRNPVAFLENCLRRYQRTVQGYTVVMQKQERIGGKLQKTEAIDCVLREQPLSVSMQWVQGARQAERAVYVEGENNGQMLVRPAGRLARAVAGDIVLRDPEGAEARQAGRYSIKQFGMKAGMLRTLAGWQAIQKKGTLKFEYLGEKKLKEADDRLCHVIRSTHPGKPAEDGVTDLTIYVDKENWLQIGSILKGDDGKLIATYYFRNLHLNPVIPPEQFTRQSFKQ